MPVRVLLVDDAAEMRTLMRTALRLRGGFQVVGEAADGETAVDLAVRCRPDIVVLDLGLPRLAGREVLLRIRQHLPAVKVVVFTGTESLDSESLRDRVEGYLVKDADVQYLLDLLEQLGGTAQRAAILDLPNDPSSPRRARRFLLNHLDRWGCESLFEPAELVVSELVTNAVSHAGGGCEVRLALTEDGLRIEVADHGDGTPEPQDTSDDDDHGRGLFLVSALAAAWGVHPIPGNGKIVWAHIALPPAA